MSSMHWIQKHILRELILRGQARYTDLKPERVEGNLFLYHLHNLIKEKFVEKAGKEYRLSDEGLRFANFYSYDSDDIRLQPKILNAIVCYDGHKVLVHQRGREPFKGKISLVNGKFHFGEASVLDSAKRELKEKTGLEAIAIERAGDTYLRYENKDGCYNHLLSHNFRCTKWNGELRETGHSKLLWLTLEEVEKNPHTLPGTVEILRLMSKNKYFFEELTFKY